MLRENVLAESNPKPKPNNQTGAHRSKDSNLALGVPKTYLVLYFCSMANDKNLAIMDHKNHAKDPLLLGWKKLKKEKEISGNLWKSIAVSKPKIKVFWILSTFLHFGRSLT